MERVKQYLVDRNAEHLCKRIYHFSNTTATVGDAAARLNCDPALVAKCVCLDLRKSAMYKKTKRQSKPGVEDVYEVDQSDSNRASWKNEKATDAALAQCTISENTPSAATAAGGEQENYSAVSDCVPIIIVTAGDSRINNVEFKKKFHAKPLMVDLNKLNDVVGFPYGGVCPFALPDNVHVYLDVSMKRFELVYAACGTANSAIGLTVEELETYSHNFVEWVDVTQGWQSPNTK